MSALPTEQPHPAHAGLDRYDTTTLVDALVADQANAALAVRAAGAELARAVDAAAPRLAAGGRIVYVGAGTSGRLGLLDSVELNPTFSWPRDRSPALLAGGERALFVAVEGAEDNREAAVADVLALKLTPNDVNVSTDLGVSYYYMNQADKALEQFEHSLTIDPKHTKTLLNIGIVKAFGKQDLEGASKAWGQVLQIAPDSPEGQAAKRALDSLASAHPGMTETSRNSGP